MITRSIAQVIRHGRRGDHLAGVEKVIGVKGPLDCTESLIDRWTEHFSIPFAPRQAVAVFAAQSAAELQDQIRYLFRDSPHPGHLRPVFEIQKGPNMQAAAARVPVKGAIGTVPSQ